MALFQIQSMEWLYSMFGNYNRTALFFSLVLEWVEWIDFILRLLYMYIYKIMREAWKPRPASDTCRALGSGYFVGAQGSSILTEYFYNRVAPFYFDSNQTVSVQEQSRSILLYSRTKRYLSTIYSVIYSPMYLKPRGYWRNPWWVPRDRDLSTSVSGKRHIYC
jgi:hypothetical protein